MRAGENNIRACSLHQRRSFKQETYRTQNGKCLASRTKTTQPGPAACLY